MPLQIHVLITPGAEGLSLLGEGHCTHRALMHVYDVRDLYWHVLAGRAAVKTCSSLISCHKREAYEVARCRQGTVLFLPVVLQLTSLAANKGLTSVHMTCRPGVAARPAADCAACGHTFGT